MIAMYLFPSGRVLVPINTVSGVGALGPHLGANRGEPGSCR